MELGRKRTGLDQAEDRAVRTLCVPSWGLLALEGRADLQREEEGHMNPPLPCLDSSFQYAAQGSH